MLDNLIFKLAILATAFFMYKYFYHLRTAKNIFGFFANRSPAVFFPLKYLPDNEEDNRSRKRANISLYIFYFLLGIALIIFSVQPKKVQQPGLTPPVRQYTYDTIIPLTDSEKAVIKDSFRDALRDTDFEKRVEKR